MRAHRPARASPCHRLRLLRNESELADPSFPQPVAPKPVRGEQLLESPGADLPGNVGSIGGERVDQRIRHGTMRPTAVIPPADNQPDPLQAGEHLLQRGEPHGVGVGHALALWLCEGQALLHGEGEPPAGVECSGYLLKQRLLFGEGEHGLEQKHHVERAGRDWGDPRYLEAAGKVATALTRDANGARAEVHPQIGATQFPGDEPSGTRNSAAQVQHGDPGCDPGLTRQRQNLAGAHEALLLDELAGRLRRHAPWPEAPEERSAIVLLHGCSAPWPLPCGGSSTVLEPRVPAARNAVPKNNSVQERSARESRIAARIASHGRRTIHSSTEPNGRISAIPSCASGRGALSGTLRSNTTQRPPGARTSAPWAMTSPHSGRCDRAYVDRIASTSVGKSNSAASACTRLTLLQPLVSIRCLAWASIASVRSTPTIQPPGPT